MLYSEVYAKAADLIDEKGLNKGDFWNSLTDAYCMEGACLEVLGKLKEVEETDYTPRIKRCTSEIDTVEQYGPIAAISNFLGIAARDFNDASGVTQKDVTNKLRELADIERKGGN